MMIGVIGSESISPYAKYVQKCRMITYLKNLNQIQDILQ